MNKDITVYKVTKNPHKLDCDCCDKKYKYVVTFRKRLIQIRLCPRHRKRLSRLLRIVSAIPTQEAFMAANIAAAKRRVSKAKR